MKFIKWTLVVLLVACGDSAQALVLDMLPEVLVQVNGRDLYKSDVRMKVMERITSGMKGSILHFPREGEVRFLKTVVEEDIKGMLLYDYVRKDAVTFSKEQTEQAETDYLQRNHLSRERYLKDLARQGKTYESFRERVLEERLIKKATLKFAGVDDVQVTEEEVRRYYQDHKMEFLVPPQVDLSHILLPLRNVIGHKDAPEAFRLQAYAKMDAAKNELAKGVPFEDVARKYSVCPSGAEGGRVGPINKMEVSQELAEVIFSLAEGQVSDIIQGPVGYHIFKVHQISPEHCRPIEEVRDNIIQTLTKAKFMQYHQALLEKLVADAVIKYAPEYLEAIGDQVIWPAEEKGTVVK